MDYETKKILEDIYRRKKPKYLKLFGAGNSLENLYNWLYSALEEVGFSDPRTTALELLDEVDLNLSYNEIKKELSSLIRLISEEQPEFEELREKEKEIARLEKELERVKSLEDVKIIRSESDYIKSKLSEIEEKIKPYDITPILDKLDRLENRLMELSSFFIGVSYEIPDFELPRDLEELINRLNEYGMLEEARVDEIDALRRKIGKLFGTDFKWVIALKTNIDLGYLDSRLMKSSYYIGGYQYLPAYILVLVTSDPRRYDYPGYVVARFISDKLSALGATTEPLTPFRNTWIIEDMRDVYGLLYRFLLYLDTEEGSKYFKLRKIVDEILESPVKYYVRFKNADYLREYYGEDLVFFEDLFTNYDGICLTSPANWKGVVEYRRIDNDKALELMKRNIRIEKI